MLRFHELAPSPNSIKVRLALALKAIPHEVIPVDPRDRGALLDLSGQELAPVIEDRGIVLPDSEAILIYLDANYPETPRLCPGDRAGRRACDDWKKELEGQLFPSWAGCFFYAIGLQPELPAEAPAGFAAALRWLEGQLRPDGTFRGLARAGGEHSQCELRAATFLLYAFPDPAVRAAVPLLGKVADTIGADPAATPRLVEFLAPWQARFAPGGR